MRFLQVLSVHFTALTLTWLPGIVRNDRRASIFVDRSYPPNLFFEIRTTNFSLRQPAAHCTPYALLILRGVLQSDCHLVLINFCSWSQRSQLHCVRLVIWSFNHWILIWLINDIMQIRLQYFEWLSIDTVQDSGIMHFQYNLSIAVLPVNLVSGLHLKRGMVVFFQIKNLPQKFWEEWRQILSCLAKW